MALTLPLSLVSFSMDLSCRVCVYATGGYSGAAVGGG